jgi:hypothetical protein
MCVAAYTKPQQYTELGIDYIADFSKTMVHSTLSWMIALLK